MTPFKAGEVTPLMQLMAVQGGVSTLAGMHLSLPEGAVVLAPATTPEPFPTQVQRHDAVSTQRANSSAQFGFDSAAPATTLVIAGSGWQVLSPWYGAIPGSPARGGLMRPDPGGGGAAGAGAPAANGGGGGQKPDGGKGGGGGGADPEGGDEKKDEKPPPTPVDPYPWFTYAKELKLREDFFVGEIETNLKADKLKYPRDRPNEARPYDRDMREKIATAQARIDEIVPLLKEANSKVELPKAPR